MAYQEEVVARYDELQSGEMKEVKVGETDILLVRKEDQYHALYAKCTHYGGPLAKGAFNDGRVVCPWHQACFDVETGRNLEAPGCDGLPTYEVRREGDEIIVRVPDETADRQTNPMADPETTSETVYAIIGAGAAGAYAAEGMREAGFTGKILLITAEEDLPYDRPNCSKAYLSGEAPEEWMPLRSADFYEEHGIEVVTGKTVDRLDVHGKRITFADGKALTYDKALVCTGGIPRQLEEGMKADNVHTLRSLQDSRTLRELGKEAKTAVIIGSSFIGLEGANSLNALDCKVTVVSPDKEPFLRVFGERIGKLLRHRHEENGVAFRLRQKVKLFEKENDHVTALRLEDDSTLAADLVLVGIGVDPLTDYIRDLEKAEDGGLVTDKYLHVENDLYAAGDIAHYPGPDGQVRIEHWKVACQQGRIAGMNMAGAEQPYDMVPFFWTNQPGINLGYAGHAEDFDEVVFDGELIEGKFLAFYIKDDEIKAVLGAGRGAELAAIRELMREGALPAPEEIEGVEDWTALLREVQEA